MKNKEGEALLIDPGSPENLMGSEWSQRQQQLAQAANRPKAEYRAMKQQLEVGGIGTGTQCATHSVQLPIALAGGQERSYTAPELPKSGTPALLGQKSLKRLRAVIDCYNAKLYLVGQGGYKMQLSPGSELHALEESHAGHLMLPCSQFKKSSEPDSVAMLAETDGKATASSSRGAVAEIARDGSVDSGKEVVDRSSL